MTTIFAMITRFLGIFDQPVLQPARVRRGAGMLEYALVLMISIAIFGVLFRFFPGFFEGVVNSLSGLISGERGGR
jgi:hypothetical protein